MAFAFVTDLFFRVNRPQPIGGSLLGDFPSGVPVDYGRTLVRGLMVAKGEQDVAANSFKFQFNPTEIDIMKDNQFFTRQRTGFAKVDDIWISGGRKTYSFQLFLDATADSNTRTFNRRVNYGESTYALLSSTNGVDLTEQGTLAQLAILESFFYPKNSEGSATFSADRATGNNTTSPQFTGGVKLPTQFIPPPVVIFTYGPLYLECKLINMTYKHVLFNKKLAPIRTEVNVTLSVIEGDIVVAPDIIVEASRETPVPSGLDSLIGKGQEIPNNFPNANITA